MIKKAAETKLRPKSSVIHMHGGPHKKESIGFLPNPCGYSME
jgi:hypothetical protein